MLPDCSGWSRFLANGFGLVQACNMHRSLPGRIGGKCFAISDRFATQFTTLRRASVLCSDGLCSRNRPIVGRTQEGAPFEAGIFGRCICSHSKTSVADLACLHSSQMQGDLQTWKRDRRQQLWIIESRTGRCLACPAEQSSAGRTPAAFGESKFRALPASEKNLTLACPPGNVPLTQIKPPELSAEAGLSTFTEGDSKLHLGEEQVPIVTGGVLLSL